MIIAAVVILAVLGIMVVIGSAVNEGRYQKYHPPSDDGITVDKEDGGENR